MAWNFGHPAPKGEPRKRVKARAQRTEATVKRAVRAMVEQRDGHCRLSGYGYRGYIGSLIGACDGASEWAHVAEQRRFKTRGQAATARHSRRGSVMLCTRHHGDYDGHRVQIEPTTSAGTDGPLKITVGDFGDGAGPNHAVRFVERILIRG